MNIFKSDEKIEFDESFFYIDDHFLKFDEQNNLREFEKKFHKKSEKVKMRKEERKKENRK